MADDMPDTLAMAKQLESAGVPPAQATAHAQVIANALLTERQYLATQVCTKSDFHVLQSDFHVLQSDVSAFQSKMLAEFARLEERTEKLIGRCKLEIISWVVSLLLVQTAITSGLIFKLLG